VVTARAGGALLLASALALLSAAPVALADQAPLPAAAQAVIDNPTAALTPDDVAVIERLQAAAEKAVLEHEAGGGEWQAEAAHGRNIALRALDVDPDTVGATPGAGNRRGAGREVYLFVSQSMFDAEMATAIAESTDRDDVTVVFLGLKKGQTLLELIQSLAGDVVTDDRAPKIQIDPTKFTEHGVSVVPTLVLVEGKTLVATARGVFSAAWLLERVDAGQRGDLGRFGPTYEVIEENMAEVFAANLKKYGETFNPSAAIDDFWSSVPARDLPAARADRSWTFDPSFVVTETVQIPNGEILALAGTRINPLQRMPFQERLLILDGRDAAQVAVALERLKDLPRMRTTIMLTALPTEGAREHFAGLHTTFGQAIYMYLDHVAERFPVRRVPSIIEAEGLVFRVTEWAVPTMLKE
jgi:conjugal transfer pilus assembly protein TraW